MADQCCHEVLSAVVRKICDVMFVDCFKISNEDGCFFLQRRWRLGLMSDADIVHRVFSRLISLMLTLFRLPFFYLFYFIFIFMIPKLIEMCIIALG